MLYLCACENRICEKKTNKRNKKREKEAIEWDTNVLLEVSIYDKECHFALLFDARVHPKTAEASNAARNVNSINRIRIYIRTDGSLFLFFVSSLSASSQRTCKELVKTS